MRLHKICIACYIIIIWKSRAGYYTNICESYFSLIFCLYFVHQPILMDTGMAIRTILTAKHSTYTLRKLKELLKNTEKWRHIWKM
jgi:hypothetical protein